MRSQVGLRKHHYKQPSGGDGIPVELLQILEDDAVKVFHLICQQIWNTQRGRRTGKGQFSFQSQRKAMPQDVQTTTELHSHMLVMEKAMETHSSTLAWKIPWTEVPGGLLSMELHRVRHDWSDLAAAANRNRVEKTQFVCKISEESRICSGRKMILTWCLWYKENYTVHSK